MNNLKLCFFLNAIIISVALYKFIHKPILDVCEIEKCPYCFGTDFCTEFFTNEIFLKKHSLIYLFTNYISTKNVFFGLYKDSNNVVLKKLAHNSELNELDIEIHTDINLPQFNDSQRYYEKIINLLDFTNDGNKLNHFKVCSKSSAVKFLNYFLNNSVDREITLKQIWTILKLNPEPLIIQLLKAEDNWPVPHYYGACGRIIIENDCGSNLNYMSEAPWNVRAKLTLQLLQAAKNFTERHPDYRFYLTDVSPDNIAVDQELKITFVDLENVIIADRIPTADNNVHHSTDIEIEDGFAFSDRDICGSSLSDHNYYTVCKLLLSKNAPWPMMKGGLLHSAPGEVIQTHDYLFKLIEECCTPTDKFNRFEIADKIMNILQTLF